MQYQVPGSVDNLPVGTYCPYIPASFQNAWYLLYSTVPGTTLVCPYIKTWPDLMLGPIFDNTTGTRVPGTVLAKYANANMTFIGCRAMHQFML